MGELRLPGLGPDKPENAASSENLSEIAASLGIELPPKQSETISRPVDRPTKKITPHVDIEDPHWIPREQVVAGPYLSENAQAEVDSLFTTFFSAPSRKKGRGEGRDLRIVTRGLDQLIFGEEHELINDPQQFSGLMLALIDGATSREDGITTRPVEFTDKLLKSLQSLGAGRRFTEEQFKSVFTATAAVEEEWSPLVETLFLGSLEKMTDPEELALQYIAATKALIGIADNPAAVEKALEVLTFSARQPTERRKLTRRFSDKVPKRLGAFLQTRLDSDIYVDLHASLDIVMAASTTTGIGEPGNLNKLQSGNRKDKEHVKMLTQQATLGGEAIGFELYGALQSAATDFSKYCEQRGIVGASSASPEDVDSFLGTLDTPYVEQIAPYIRRFTESKDVDIARQGHMAFMLDNFKGRLIEASKEGAEDSFRKDGHEVDIKSFSPVVPLNFKKENSLGQHE